jgi:hypothetical protein
MRRISFDRKEVMQNKPDDAFPRARCNDQSLSDVVRRK